MSAAIEIFNCEQGTPEWFACRAGIPTASQFKTVMANGRGGKESETRRKYLYDLAGEVLTEECAETYSNAHMERGHVMEAEARDWYVFQTDAELQRVGFIRNNLFHAGFSPDSLIGADGGLEIKTKLPRLQLELLESGKLPSEHVAQVQGSLWLAGRQWWDFVSYWPRLKPFKLRVYRDESYIDSLAVAVREFNEELEALVERHR